ncbi:hypothetical protein [Selenomonas sp. KH1T6]|uniref:hypothetical protein n=1 Tax=Selenomonas sp. KH1T6 TaxID=3158784 RepID=UPI0008A7676E|nr:hypothetical protein SAMN05216583_13013 [Selenomonas ruminantium]
MMGSKLIRLLCFMIVMLCGKVRVVEHFADIKVKVVDSFPDLRVKVVSAFPYEVGEW